METKGQKTWEKPPNLSGDQTKQNKNKNPEPLGRIQEAAIGERGGKSRRARCHEEEIEEVGLSRDHGAATWGTSSSCQALSLEVALHVPLEMPSVALPQTFRRSNLDGIQPRACQTPAASGSLGTGAPPRPSDAGGLGRGPGGAHIWPVPRGRCFCPGTEDAGRPGTCTSAPAVG